MADEEPRYRLFLTLERHGGELQPLQVGILGNLSEEEAEIVRQSCITQDVTAALWHKQLVGAKEHNFVMQPFDGQVDALAEAMQECLDLAQYLMKARLEQGGQEAKPSG